MLPAALCRAVDSASRRSFLFILMLQSFGCREAPVCRVSIQGSYRPVAAYKKITDALPIRVQHSLSASSTCLLTDLGAEDDAATRPQWRPRAALPCIAGPLLRQRLPAAAPHLCPCLGAGGTLHDGDELGQHGRLQRSVGCCWRRSGQKFGAPARPGVMSEIKVAPRGRSAVP